MVNFINNWSSSDFEIHMSGLLDKRANVTNIEIAGDGNMNFTYRLKFEDKSSVIIKQSPPYCARFPDIPAPEDRIISEFKYYEFATKDPFLAEHSPELLGLDKELKIAYISDLGTATDFEYLYTQEKKVARETCNKLLQYLVSLHKLEIPACEDFDNLEMRKLNHEYIFELPFLSEDNAIDLNAVTPGLSSAAQEIKNDVKLRAAANELGGLYFQKTRTLIHGDYYPMSWIKTEKGLFIIDPEFGFFGLPEIDLGVFLAHMVLSNNFEVALNAVKEIYGPCDFELVAKFCAVEVIRRITYVSQLPLVNNLAFKKDLLARSSITLKTGGIENYENIDHHTS